MLCFFQPQLFIFPYSNSHLESCPHAFNLDPDQESVAIRTNRSLHDNRAVGGHWCKCFDWHPPIHHLTHHLHPVPSPWFPLLPLFGLSWGHRESKVYLTFHCFGINRDFLISPRFYFQIVSELLHNLQRLDIWLVISVPNWPLCQDLSTYSI